MSGPVERVDVLRASPLVKSLFYPKFNPSRANYEACKLPTGGNGACSQPGMPIVSGFGSINAATTAYPPRTGQLVAQFQF